MASDALKTLVAVHEAAHAHIWKSVGIKPGLITLRDLGQHVKGFVELDGGEIESPDALEAYLVGTAAGKIAGDRWLADNGHPRLQQDCKVDMRTIKKNLRDPLAKNLQRSHVMAASTRLVSTNWTQICSTADRLVERGSLML